MRVAPFALALALVLSGCAGFSAIDPQKRVAVGDDITVEPQVAWAQAIGQGTSGVTWTIDGLGLDELRFYTAIAPGAPLMKIPGVASKDMVAYSPSMLPDDVMELVASTLGKAGNQQIRTSGLHPQPFGSMTGFRFDIAYVTKDGLQMKGTALIAQRRGKLDAILFVAPAEYYFDHGAPIVDRVLTSIRIPDGAGPAKNG